MDADPTGSWTLPDEYVMLRDSVRRFMEREVRPAEEALPHDATSLPPDVLARLQAQAWPVSLDSDDFQRPWNYSETLIKKYVNLTPSKERQNLIGVV